MLKAHGRCLILAPVSRALRLCVAAYEAGLDLTGATCMIAGEPPTPAKVRGITRTGARCFPTYGLAEIGRIGVGCAQPAGCNDLHLLKDAFALIQYPRRVPGAESSVDAFNVTTLLLTTPTLMLNVEIDDYGILETRSCGCPLEQLGFTEHVQEIRSFSKLTGEGVTLIGSEMIYILEDVLPTRFGGSALDYQLIEEEDEQGFTRLSLLVSPKIELADERVVIETVLDALGHGSVMADSARAIWRQAQTLRVKRAEPVWTARGKLMPLHLVRRNNSSPS
jgi:phenylacetate-coenzyme A ligase PaaK-like adenylate-forming protein